MELNALAMSTPTSVQSGWASNAVRMPRVTASDPPDTATPSWNGRRASWKSWRMWVAMELLANRIQTSPMATGRTPFEFGLAKARSLLEAKALATPSGILPETMCGRKAASWSRPVSSSSAGNKSRMCSKVQPVGPGFDSRGALASVCRYTPVGMFNAAAGSNACTQSGMGSFSGGWRASSAAFVAGDLGAGSDGTNVRAALDGSPALIRRKALRMFFSSCSAPAFCKFWGGLSGVSLSLRLVACATNSFCKPCQSPSM